MSDIVTISYVATGIIVAFAQGRKLLGTASPALEAIVNGKINGFHVIILLWIGLTIAAEFILRRTRTVQTLLSVGTNETAATLSGVRVKSFRLGVYGFSGMMSALFGGLRNRWDLPCGGAGQLYWYLRRCHRIYLPVILPRNGQH
jgi:ribose transport system permease protein